MLLLLACTPDSSLRSVAEDPTGTLGTDIPSDETTDTTRSASLLRVDVAWEPRDALLDTRDLLTFTVTGVWDDGATEDVTSTSSFRSDAPEILDFYVAGVGRPLDGGEAVVTVENEDLAPGEVLARVDVTVTVAAAGASDLVFNELLCDPATTDDPNEDGTSDPVEDEFVEIANAADVTLDLSGVSIWDSDIDLARHTFARGTTLRAGEAIVVFGGGNVSRLSGSNVRFEVADNEDSGLQYGLALNNAGDRPSLRSASGAEIAATPYGDEGTNDAVDDASIVLAPEVYGSRYVEHTWADGADGDWSPGSFADGSAFPGPEGVYGP